ncbi:hypothetical protein N480_00630 [Pseudoalteromonas luteoviolacea S2607]|uniref:DUF4291 domain-containing protein n=1 Tax=Pseudoalteromonas luteoviolacea TaxID=43657 RepID=UPI0007B0BFD7|nr:DUF4291 domain-containing protein [Pseudoalteromonas luteoviolacea]KZN39367.1 hypothetical protein N480_00630 [Pseudoalteromonas luteoviolacea S2607]
MTFPTRQIRAVYDNKTIRVYQAYNDAIANSTLANGTFISPPFKMERMTWIKPSFLWMMYRSGWAKKDTGQNRILAIDISREGFEWALDNSLLSNKAKEFTDREAWLKLKNSTPVRIQWDPERDINLQPLEHRAIQIGLSNEAVDLYVNQWVQKVTDVTELAAQIKGYVDNNQLEAARALLPNEVPYNLNTNLKDKIMAD